MQTNHDLQSVIIIGAFLNKTSGSFYKQLILKGCIFILIKNIF